MNEVDVSLWGQQDRKRSELDNLKERSELDNFPVDNDSLKKKEGSYENLTSNTAQLVLGLLQAEAITRSSKERFSTETNLEKAIPVLRKLYEKIIDEAEARIEYPPPNPETVRDSYSSLLKGYMDMEIMTGSQIAIVGKQLKPSGLRITDSDRASFKGRGTDMGIEIGNEAYQKSCNGLNDILSSSGIGLDQDAVGRVTLKFLMGHEYGHGVDEAAIATNRRRNIHDQLYRKMAPNNDLEDVVKRYGLSEPEDTSYERIAVAFERVSLEIALQNEGVSLDKIKVVLDRFDQRDEKLLGDQKILLEALTNRGLSMYLLNEGLINLKQKLEEDNQEDLVVWSRYSVLDVSMLGYCFPLKQDELKGYIALFFSSLRVFESSV